MTDVISARPAPAIGTPGRGTPATDSWGTSTLFRELSGTGLDEAVYWVTAVYRPAHRTGHPFLNVHNCPGCAYEAMARGAVAA